MAGSAFEDPRESRGPRSPSRPRRVAGRLGATVTEAYPVGLIALYLVLLAGLVAIRWAVPDKAFKDIGWILAIAAIPLLPWVLAYARTIFTSVKLGSVELTFADAKADATSVEDIQHVNDPAILEQGIVTFTNTMTSRAQEMTARVLEIRAQRAEVVPLDLGAGNRWLLPNLYILSLLLEVKTVVARLVFTEARNGRTGVLVGSCSPFALRLALDQAKPAYELAKHRTKIGPIEQVAPSFFSALREVVPAGTPESEYAPWVTGDTLVALLGTGLDARTAIEQEELMGGRGYSRVLAFEERFIPVLSDGEVVSVIDQFKVARTIARRAVAGRV